MRNFSPKNRFIFWIAALVLSITVNLVIFRGAYSNFLIFAWLLSILLPLGAFAKITSSKPKNIPYLAALVLLISLPVMVRIANYNLNRIHGDDIITAYFSSHYDFAKNNFFAPVPLNKGDWVCQFPSVFFVLQKLFFLAFGESLLTIKLSVIPYVFLVSLMLFLTTTKIFDKKTGAVAVIIYSFLAISLYHETLGLHFVSSTAFFLIFFYFLILNFRESRYSYAYLCGIFCGFCYLSYTSSYITLPLLLFASTLKLFRPQKILTLKNFLVTMVGFLVVVSPFLIYMFRFKSFYLTGRINQVNLVSGSWSNTATLVREGKVLTKVITDNLVTSLKSFYLPGIGGHGGYDFGRLAFFNRITLELFVLGVLITLSLCWKKVELLLVALIIVTSFTTGMVLTIPPPAYHRLSLTFPFLAMIISLPFAVLLRLPKRVNLFLGLPITLILLAFFAVSNQQYFAESTKEQENSSSLRLAKFLASNYPNRPVYVASFPSFALEKIIYFVRPRNENNKVLGVSTMGSLFQGADSPTLVKTEYHQTFLDNFDPHQKYLYVITMPDSFEKEFQHLDPSGKIYKFSSDYSLFTN